MPSRLISSHAVSWHGILPRPTPPRPASGLTPSLGSAAQAIIGYLQAKGFPEIAMQFVQDDRVKFGLAIESCNIDVAMECAVKLDEPALWAQLADVALRVGQVGVAEKCYQRTKNFERLSFLCLITGQHEKLKKMLKIAQAHGDTMGCFQNSLYLGDMAERVGILEGAGHDMLALLAATNHGLDEQAVSIGERLESAGVDTAEFVNPDAELLLPLPAINRDTDWPMLEIPGAAPDPTPAAARAPPCRDDTLDGETPCEGSTEPPTLMI